MAEGTTEGAAGPLLLGWRDEGEDEVEDEDVADVVAKENEWGRERDIWAWAIYGGLTPGGGGGGCLAALNGRGPGRGRGEESGGGGSF